ncbi:MAG: DUF362 domain-containing protein [Promethearchaeota archaeon]
MDATTLDPTAVTSPNVILATLKVVKDELSGDYNRVHIFDNSAVGLPTRVVFKMRNLAKKIKKLGANPLYLNEQEPVMIDIKGKALDKPIPFPKILYDKLVKNRQENTYINIPKLKTHLQTGITACLKNQHGLLYDQEKIYNHHRIDDKIIELYRLIQPDFNLVDTTKVVKHGANSFSPDWEIPLNLLLAGIDGFAVDTVGAKLLGIPMSNVKYLKIAHEEKLGGASFENIELLPNNEFLEKHKMKLNDQYSNVPLEMAKNFHVIRGKEWAGCRAGCKGLLEYFHMMTAGMEISPVTCICGRGHNLSQLDGIKEPVVLTGPCAIEELKEYFESRPDRKDLTIACIWDHFSIKDIVGPLRKLSKHSYKQLSTMMQIDLFALISGMIIAKLKKARFIGLF